MIISFSHFNIRVIDIRLIIFFIVFYPVLFLNVFGKFPNLFIKNSGNRFLPLNRKVFVRIFRCQCLYLAAAWTELAKLASASESVPA